MARTIAGMRLLLRLRPGHRELTGNTMHMHRPVSSTARRMRRKITGTIWGAFPKITRIKATNECG